MRHRRDRQTLFNTVQTRGRREWLRWLWHRDMFFLELEFFLFGVFFPTAFGIFWWLWAAFAGFWLLVVFGL